MLLWKLKEKLLDLIAEALPKMGLEKIARFDIYRKVPKDLTQPTVTGAIISVICCFIISVLLFSEFLRYLRLEIVSEVYVDNPGADSSRIPVSLTVELPNLKCEYVGLDIQDDMGRHEVGFVDNTEKTPIGHNHEGCLFHSTFQINKVPGNFHVSTHASHHENPDFSHTIKEIRFGDLILANVPGSFNPLAGVSKSSQPASHGYFESHDYIMKIVPTVYQSYRGKDTISYQYTYAYRSFSRGTSALWFRYDLSPLTVKYREKGEDVFSFSTAVCAVVGGVFTVATMIDGLIFSASELYKKVTLGKIN